MTTPNQPTAAETEVRSGRRRRQPGETRDSQSKRLTTTVYVDATSTIRYVVQTLEPNRSNTEELNEFENKGVLFV